MARVVLVFASARTAATNVAGVPAIARAAREAALAIEAVPACRELVVVLPKGRLEDDWCLAEITRLSFATTINFVALNAFVPSIGDLCLAGERLTEAETIVGQLRAIEAAPSQVTAMENFEEIVQFHDIKGSADLADQLGDAGKMLVRNTIKPTDGIVSRHLNRAVSTRITAILLQMRPVRPIHATALAALCAVAMFTCLVSGRPGGLIVGAILFQIASIIDGIDGEIARATFRTTAIGATLDSVTDAATNLAFVVGLGVGLAQLGDQEALLRGVVGFACLAIGLLLLGGHALVSGRSVNFDALKHVVRRRHPALANWLIWLTMRDFLALAGAIMVIIGQGRMFLMLFSVGSCLWLMAVTVFVLHDIRQARRLMTGQLSGIAMGEPRSEAGRSRI